MAIEASIQELELFELLQLISLTGKNGILTLNDEETVRDYTLYLKDGKLVYIDLTNRLKEEMVKRGFLNREEIAKIPDKELIEHIVENEIMTPNTLKVLFKQIAEELVYSLFLIKSGHLSFKEREFSIPYSMDLRMRIENVILKAARRMDEISKMKGILPSRDVILEVSRDVIDTVAINLSPMDWKLLSLIDGKRTIAELKREVGDEFAVLKSLYGMTMAGIITKKKIDLVDKAKEPKGDLDEVQDGLKSLSRFWNKGKYVGGIKTLLELKKRYPDNPGIIYEMGYFYLARGKFKEAISEWNLYLLLSEDKKRKEEIRENLELVKKLHKKMMDREANYKSGQSSI
ncbi:MAG: DUF4388 domain-containing protein [candidate division WOR-3 bacterium]|nr:DUF4388 domain-containing protein [candidate division WOR-3 bacterium]